MSNFFDTATLIFAFVWVICMGASFIAVLDWDGIIEAKRLKLLVPAAVVAQMLMLLWCFFELYHRDSEHD